jgi:hypothetical protein
VPVKISMVVSVVAFFEEILSLFVHQRSMYSTSPTVCPCHHPHSVKLFLCFVLFVCLLVFLDVFEEVCDECEFLSHKKETQLTQRTTTERQARTTIRQLIIRGRDDVYFACNTLNSNFKTQLIINAKCVCSCFENHKSMEIYTFIDLISYKRSNLNNISEQLNSNRRF